MANIILPQVAIKNQLSGGENFLIETNGEIQRVAADIVGTNIEVDTTLTQRGMAADAKATGDSIQTAVDNIQTAVDSKVSKTGDTITGSLKLQGNLTNVNAIEFGGNTNHGGYIDFHYGKNTADYTSRLIEYEEGVLSVNEGNSVKLGNILLNNSSYGSTLPETATPGQLFFKKTTGTIADMDTNLVSELMLKIYPVGSVYMSMDATSPAQLFGGTWQQRTDRFLVAAGNAYAVGSIGGSGTVTLTEANLPRDSIIFSGSATSAGWSVGKWGANGSADWYAMPKSQTSSTAVNSLENKPPYLAVYMWIRTA